MLLESLECILEQDPQIYALFSLGKFLNDVLSMNKSSWVIQLSACRTTQHISRRIIWDGIGCNRERRRRSDFQL